MLIFKALDRLVEAGWQHHELTKFAESGFLLDRSSWGTMDTYGMGPQRNIFPPRDISYSGLIFPEQDFLQMPEPESFGPDLGLSGDQTRMLQAHFKAASIANRFAMEQYQARWVTRFSTLHGILEQTANGVKEDLAQWLDLEKTLDLDEQRLIRHRPHFVKPSTLAARHQLSLGERHLSPKGQQGQRSSRMGNRSTACEEEVNPLSPQQTHS